MMRARQLMLHAIESIHLTLSVSATSVAAPLRKFSKAEAGVLRMISGKVERKSRIRVSISGAA
jgi:hypothetical protein